MLGKASLGRAFRFRLRLTFWSNCPRSGLGQAIHNHLRRRSSKLLWGGQKEINSLMPPKLISC